MSLIDRMPSGFADREAGVPRPMLLLVVDEPGAETIARLALQAEGYGVEVLPSDAHPIEFFEKSNPDGLVIDIARPTGSALATCGLLTARRRSLPALVVSARLDPTTIDAARVAGASLIMTKPFATAVLIETIRTLVGWPVTAT